jgi:hypothetical protein
MPSVTLPPGRLPDVVDSINDGDVTRPLRPTPPLPRRLLGLWPVVIAGTGLWFAAFAVLLVSCLVSGGSPNVWLWSTVAGVALGFVGLGIMAWQRAAFRRGSRGAQRNL